MVRSSASQGLSTANFWRRMCIAFAALCGATALLTVSPRTAWAVPTVTYQEVASGFASPVEMANSGDGSGRLFVVEQGGVIKILANGNVLATPFLNISGLTAGGGERGLLGLAFHPQYASNRAFYVYYTKASDGSLVIARYLRSSSDPLQADAQSGVPILEIPHPTYSNHNGGHIAFGPDGYLYIGTGDGGGGGDPDANGQRLNTRLAKMLRISVDGGTGYTIPAGNPFAGSSCSTACPEIWAYGLRNPWKFTFDRATGDLFIGDVGQGLWEEIDRVPRDTTGPLNFGWNTFEATRCYGATTCAIGAGLAPHTPPIIEYGHDSNGGFSVTGGYMYRGARSTSLRGYYIYGDFSSQRVWAAKPNASGIWVPELLPFSPSSISSFGEDEKGEIYIVGYGTGKIYAIRGPLSSPNDLTGDSRSDVVYRDASGALGLITMNGAAVAADNTVLVAGSPWSTTHVADFNGDGKSDLIIRRSDGNTAILLMNGSGISSATTLLNAGSSYRVSHTGDFDGDGKADILLKNTDGSIAILLMDGGTVKSAALLVGAGSTYTVALTADLDGDGNSDVVLASADGSIAVVTMAGTSVKRAALLTGPGSPWTARYAADFNGDGKADLVLKNADGSVALLQMNGTTITAAVPLFLAASPWDVAGTGDFNGDGKADILIKNVDGSVAIFLMNGTTVTEAGVLLAAASPYSIAQVGDFNADGKSDLLLKKTDGSAVAVLMNGVTVTAAVFVWTAGTRAVDPP
jgi:Glucose / Sorbosone dehydrogenase/FG-GAP-like repeat